MLRKLIGYIGKYNPKEKLHAVISTDPEIDITAFIKDCEKIKAEITALEADKTLNPHIRDYIVGFARMCLPEELKSTQDIVNKYQVAAEKLGERSLYLELFLNRKSKDKNISPYIQQVATELLTRCAARGNKLAFTPLRWRIMTCRLQYAEGMPQLLHSLDCLNVLDFKNKESEKEFDMCSLYCFFHKDNFVTKSPDIDEALYWISTCSEPGFNIRDELKKYNTPLAFSFLGDCYADSFSFRDKGRLSQLIHHIEKLDMPYGQKQACLAYLKSPRIGDDLGPPLNEIYQKNAGLALTYGENFLAAKLYFRAALNTHSLINPSEARRHQLKYFKSACEALKLNRPSHYHLLGHVLLQLEKLLPFEPNAVPVYVTFKEKYDKQMQEYISHVKNAEQREREKRIAMSTMEKFLSSDAIVKQKTESKEKSKEFKVTTPAVPPVPKMPSQLSSPIDFETARAAKTLQEITDLLKDNEILDKDVDYSRELGTSCYQRLT
ncbi:MAG: hypothetical protein ACYCQI_02935 [Gammaproteobacteria bacterium]